MSAGAVTAPPLPSGRCSGLYKAVREARTRLGLEKLQYPESCVWTEPPPLGSPVLTLQVGTLWAPRRGSSGGVLRQLGLCSASAAGWQMGCLHSPATVPCVVMETSRAWCLLRDCPAASTIITALQLIKSEKQTLFDFYLHKLITKLFLTVDEASPPVYLSSWLPPG